MDILKKLSPIPGPTLPRPDLPVRFSGTNTSPFVSLAELDYRNSYEIEYMEKISPPLPVSSVPRQSGDWLAGFPTPPFVVETQHTPPPMVKVSLGNQTSDQGPSVPTASWVTVRLSGGWGVRGRYSVPFRWHFPGRNDRTQVSRRIISLD